MEQIMDELRQLLEKAERKELSPEDNVKMWVIRKLAEKDVFVTHAEIEEGDTPKHILVEYVDNEQE